MQHRPTTKPALFLDALWNLQDLPRLDLVRIRQLIAVRVENGWVGVRITKELLGDLAQRVACFDRVGLLRPAARLSAAGGRAASRCLDVGDDLVFPIRN